MLTIHIVGFDSNEKLKLEVNGQPNNGHSQAYKGSPVQWIVTGKGIGGISDIKIKNMPGSTDIFSADPPGADQLNPHPEKNWKGTINADAEDCSFYIYDIVWFKGKVEENNKRTFDPIISIKPQSTSFFKVLLGFIAGFFCLFLFTRKKK